MKSLVVIADTHNQMRISEQFFTILDECDYIIHLGDGTSDMANLKEIWKDKLYCVRGNNDYCDLPYSRTLQVEDVKIFMTHGHKFKVKSTTIDIELQCLMDSAQLGLYGHTHIPNIEQHGNVTLINPGSYTYSNSYCYIIIEKDKAYCRIVQLP